jgi:phage protein D
MTQAPKPVWLVTYEGRDVSDELSPMIVSCEYTDALHGKSDAIELTLEDRAGRWRSGWWPSEGDEVALQMGLDGAPLLDCGRFKLGPVKLKGPPDVVTLSGLATGRVQPLRTEQSRAFEDITLADVVSQLAREYGLEVVGEVSPIRIGRITQNRETTLAFLRRLASEYGYAFSIRSGRLVFYELKALEAAPPVLQIARTDLGGYDFEASAQATYAACELSYFDPGTKQLRTVRVVEQHARERVVLGSGAAGPVATRQLPSRTLRRGMTGEDVKWWQSFLLEQGADVGAIDGVFGRQTHAATMAFQRSGGIGIDGVAGPETYRTALERGYQTPGGTSTRTEVVGDVLRIERRVESEEQALAQARAALAEANRLRLTGKLELEGRRHLVSGVTIELGDMVRASGKYLVQEAKHRISRSNGWRCSAEVTVV